MEVFKTFTFEAAHRLPNLPPEHKCFRMHGHSYRIELHVEGPVDRDLGWVVDFGEIKRIFRPVLERLDHQVLNEVDGLPEDGSLTEIVFESDDVRSAHTDLADRGVPFEVDLRPVMADGDKELLAAHFRDPDGHLIELAQQLERK